ncbi:MAG: T9SS type A sorting domain-containing protein [Rhodothermales bacterium]|nr:T9SS type A sorting domain-containing protein [Rhodothermales bacterium]
MALFVLLSTAIPASAQPSYPVIFDDFLYTNVAEVFGQNDWFDLSGTATRTNQEFWYRNSWEPNGGTYNFASNTTVAMESIAGQGHLRLQGDSGHAQNFGNGVNSPVIASGFTAQTGTWVTAVRLDDLRAAAEITTAFWTYSPNQACDEAPTTHCPHFLTKGNMFWSEFNHEWNNYFRVLSREGDDSLHVPVENMILDSGAVVDGPDDASNATGGLILGNNTKTGEARHYTCWQRRGPNGMDDDGEVDDYYARTDAECREWFVGGTQKHAVLFTQYDGRYLTYKALAFNYALAGGLGDFVYMDYTRDIGLEAQPMLTKYSVLPNKGHPMTSSVGMSIDWFFYTPDTGTDVWDVLGDVTWLRDPVNDLPPRINTTTISQEQPPASATISPDLHSTLGLPGWAQDKWVVVLDPVRAANFYNIDWRYRTHDGGTLSPWIAVSDIGFSFELPISLTSYEDVQVEVTINDYDGNVHDAVVCGEVTANGTSYEQYAGSCGPLYAPKRGTSRTLPKTFALEQNYPNPFNPTTSITFSLAEAGEVTLDVYDLVGRHIGELANGVFESGTHSVSWDATAQPSGQYWYVLRSGDQSLRRAMNLLK